MTTGRAHLRRVNPFAPWYELSCHCERSEAIPIPLRCAMEIAALAPGLGHAVAPLLAMTAPALTLAYLSSQIVARS
jgi:hypothetical protein